MDSTPWMPTAGEAGHAPDDRRSARPVRGRYAVIPGRVEVHKPDVLALARRNLTGPPEQPEVRYRKYYEGNPLGPPAFFLAEDPDARRFVGMAAVFRTKLSIAGEPVPAGISGDFAVDEEHRGFGPALALQRATLAAIPENELACAYGSPNPFSEPVLERVGYTDVGRLTRFLKPLRTRIVVEAYIRRPRLARLASAALSVTADPLLSLVSLERRARRSPDLRVERPAAFEESRFASVFESIRRQHGITGARDAQILNWKYGLGDDGPRPGDFSILAVAGPTGAVAGYVVSRVKDGVRHVFDIGYLPSQPVIDSLLSELVRGARREGCAGITFLYLGPRNLLTRRLRAFGFFSRAEEKRLWVYGNGSRAPAVDLFARDNWYFLTGDDDF